MKLKLFLTLASTLLLVPAVSSAIPVTLTFDSGAYDPTITSPSGIEHGPFDWLESGVRIAGFWAIDVGTAQGGYLQGHTHIDSDPDILTGFAEKTHSWTGDLQGLEISLINGGTFDLVSIDYDIEALDAWTDYQQRLPWSFAVEDPQIVVTESFDPSAPDFESQWTAFDALEDGNWRTRDWHTLSVTGFDDVTSVMISQTAFLTWIDNIVIDVHGPTVPVPEPSTAMLLGLGLAGLTRRRTTHA